MKKVYNAFVSLAVIFFIWFLISFVNFNMANDPFSRNYQKPANWNLITIITESSQNVY